MYAAFLSEWVHDDALSTGSLEHNDKGDSPSAHFAEEFDLLCSLSKWPSANYQLLRVRCSSFFCALVGLSVVILK